MTSQTSAKIIDIQLHIALRDLRGYLERIRGSIEAVKNVWLEMSIEAREVPGTMEEFEEMLSRLVNLKMIVIKRMDAIYGEIDDEPMPPEGL